MRKTITILTALAALAATSTAHALDGPYPVDTRPELGPYLPTARAAWPDSPCAGREQIAYATNIGANSGLDLDAGAVPDQCLVFVNSRMLPVDQGGRYKLCALLTHEFGHLAGFEHSDDLSSIMHTPTPGNYMPCLDVAGLVPSPIEVHETTTTAKPRVKKCRQANAKKRRACRSKKH